MSQGHDEAACETYQSAHCGNTASLFSILSHLALEEHTTLEGIRTRTLDHVDERAGVENDLPSSAQVVLNFHRTTLTMDTFANTGAACAQLLMLS